MMTSFGFIAAYAVLIAIASVAVAVAVPAVASVSCVLALKGSDHEVSVKFHCDKIGRPLAAGEIEPRRDPIHAA
jgi:hypothetical protein